MNNILVKEAKKCMKVSRIKPKFQPVKTKEKSCKWYNSECSGLKTRLKNQACLLMKNPKDPFIRGQYNKTKKMYRKTDQTAV